MARAANEESRGTAGQLAFLPERTRRATDAAPSSGGRITRGRALAIARTPAITVALIGGQRLLRDATATLLAREEALDVLGSFASAEDYVAHGGGALTGAVLLLDCDENDPACWEREISRLITPYAKTSIVLLCREACEAVLRCAVEQRVSGVILKSYTTRQIRQTIAYIATGRTVMPAGWQRAFAGGQRNPLGPSPRQHQILALIAQGRCNQEIAAELGLSRNTVKFHIRELYARLGVRNRVEAANQYAQLSDGGG